MPPHPQVHAKNTSEPTFHDTAIDAAASPSRRENLLEEIETSEINLIKWTFVKSGEIMCDRVKLWLWLVLKTISARKGKTFRKTTNRGG